MNCPHCGGQNYFERRQNFTHREPAGNEIFVHTVTLPELVEALVCAGCGFSWKKGVI